MSAGVPGSNLQLRSLIRESGELELSLVETPLPAPAEDEVIVRVEATPLNPSDLGLLFGAADFRTAKASGSPSNPIITATVPPNAMKMMAGRVGQSMPVGNEGAGTVVAAGASQRARGLLGRTVAIMGGAMYAQYRTVKASHCLLLPEGVSAADGASAFVNPMTAVGMVETMRREGHTALVHTAAASNLGQMLNRICLKEGVPLVNIVRKPEQAEILSAIGATIICDSSAPTFVADLTEALAATGATIAFDAIGGGRIASQILGCMETAISRNATEYSRYGSSVLKQVYIYGALDRSPTELIRSFGLTWNLGGWLLFGFLQKIGPDATAALKTRIASEIKTTFASRYTRSVTLAGALSLAEIAEYGKQATGTKYLITPHGQ